MLKITKSAETKDIKPSTEDCSLGDVNKRWHNIFCSHINCNGVSQLFTIIPLQSAKLGSEDARWEWVYADNANVNSVQAQEISTSNLSSQTISAQNDISIGGSVTASQLQCSSANVSGQLQCSSAIANTIDVGDKITTKSLFVNQDITSNSITSNSITSQGSISCVSMTSSSVTTGQLQCSNLSTSNLSVSGQFSIQSLSAQNISSNSITSHAITTNNLNTSGTIYTNNINVSGALSSSSITTSSLSVASNTSTQNINVNNEANIYSCLVSTYLRAPHIVFLNGWSIAPAGDGLAFYNRNGYAVLIIRNDGIWFNGNKIV